MTSEVLLSNIIPFAGSGLVGYAIGFAPKYLVHIGDGVDMQYIHETMFY
jgi:hypothetical protein